MLLTNGIKNMSNVRLRHMNKKSHL